MNNTKINQITGRLYMHIKNQEIVWLKKEKEKKKTDRQTESNWLLRQYAKIRKTLPRVRSGEENNQSEDRPTPFIKSLLDASVPTRS